MGMRARLLLVIAAAMVAAPRLFADPPPLNGVYIATAYALKGVTASGQWVHRHVVAADPDLLPIGSRIKIKRAGRYSGEYVVADTGEKIQGRRLDIYLPTVKACKKFGSKPVKVKLIQLGDGTHATAKVADQAVKQDVQKDIQKNVVGNAATEADWAGKRGNEKAQATPTTTSTSAPATSTSTKPDHN
jgi:3D (Asp-Asp-Asp) domain-containing protein